MLTAVLAAVQMLALKLLQKQAVMLQMLCCQSLQSQLSLDELQPRMLMFLQMPRSLLLQMRVTTLLQMRAEKLQTRRLQVLQRGMPAGPRRPELLVLHRKDC